MFRQNNQMHTATTIWEKIRQKILRKMCNYYFCIVLISLAFSSPIYAFPFPLQDARSAALGGAGIAIDVRNAPFGNPALMASNDENYDWIVMFPSRGLIETEGDEFNEKLEEFQQLKPIPRSTESNDLLAAMDQQVTMETRFNAVTVVVPNELISAVAFYKKYVFNSTKIKRGVEDQGGPNNLYDAFVEHRNFRVQEQGVSLAKLLGRVMFGVNVKLSLINTYGYDEDILNGSTVFNSENPVERISAVNFDIGLAREVGVWKMGIVVKDVFSFEREYGNSGELYKVKPMVRVGFAYRSRKTLWELDADLTKNSPVVRQTETKFLAMGFEHELFSGLFIRFGARKNIVGDLLLTQTAGIGLNYFGIEVNIAVLQNSEETGAFSQLIVEF